MNDKHRNRIKVRYESQPPVRLTRLGNGVLRVAGVGVAVAAAFGTVKAPDVFAYHEVGTHEVVLQPGEAPQAAVGRGVHTIADKDNFDANELRDREIVHAGQEAYGDFIPGIDKSIPQPGDKIEVTISKNRLGDYNVEADPIPIENKN